MPAVIMVTVDVVVAIDRPENVALYGEYEDKGGKRAILRAISHAGS